MNVDLLRPEDIDAALALSEAEGWNQTVADWSRILGLEPAGCFAAREDGRLIGTVTTTTYGVALAWIGMMVVHPAHRRRGVGATLMRMALDHLHGLGIQTVKLDATPAGRPLYESLGFEAETVLERWQGVACPLDYELPPAMPPFGVGALDRKAYGVSRTRLLKRLAAEGVGEPVVIGSGDELFGFVLARPGRIAYIGPLVAMRQEAAAPLLDRILARLAGWDVCLDRHQGGFMKDKALVERGLTRQRMLTRMSHGPRIDAATGPLICAIAGPEFG